MTTDFMWYTGNVRLQTHRDKTNILSNHHTIGVTPVMGPGDESNGKKWVDCCGSLIPPESQSQWLILRHGSISCRPSR